MCLSRDRLEGVLGSNDKMILKKEEAASGKQTRAELSREEREREKSGQRSSPVFIPVSAPLPHPGQLWAAGPGCCVVIDEP